LLPTLTLAVPALVLASVLGTVLGVVGALRGGGLARVLTSLALSTPIYWTGTLAIYVFTVQLGVLPSAGAGRLSQLVLPVGVLGFHTAGAIARLTQTHVRAALNAAFVQVARSKGLRERQVLLRHVLRVGLLPIVQVIALQAGFLLSGTVITEMLFVRPGMGKLLYDSTLKQDYPVVQGIVIVSAVVYTLLNTLADLLYPLLDPRVMRSG
jgi:peptide/nickel transport system permease protein